MGNALPGFPTLQRNQAKLIFNPDGAAAAARTFTQQHSYASHRSHPFTSTPSETAVKNINTDLLTYLEMCGAWGGRAHQRPLNPHSHRWVGNAWVPHLAVVLFERLCHSWEWDCLGTSNCSGTFREQEVHWGGSASPASSPTACPCPHSREWESLSASHSICPCCQ